jgi:hypothetical protein
MMQLFLQVVQLAQLWVVHKEPSWRVLGSGLQSGGRRWNEKYRYRYNRLHGVTSR